MAHLDTDAKRRPRRGCWGCAGWGLLVLFILVLLLVGAGMAYNALGTARDRRAFPPPGQMVQVNDHSLHLYCIGAGSPTVVLEAGSGQWSLDWSLVQPEIARFTRVCAYDRAGYGWSEPGPQPRSGQQIVTELHNLLHNAGIEGPYLLVGHSLGGRYVRLYADRYPDEVVGLVLVDATPDGFVTPPEYDRAEASYRSTMRVLGWLARLGVLRLMGRFAGGDAAAMPIMPPALEYLPAEMRVRYLAIGMQPHYFDAVLAESEAMDDLEAELQAARPLGDLPLIVLSHGIPAPPLPGVSAEQAAQMEQEWQSFQRQQAALSSQGMLIVADRSGHLIPYEQPDLVVDAVRQIVEAVKR